MNLNECRIRRIATTAPAPGNGASINSPGPFESTLIGLTFSFTPDANAADRIVDLLHSDGSTAEHFAGPQAIITAGTAILLSYGTTAVYKILTALPRYDMGLLPDCAVPTAGNITIQVTNIQAGDQIDDIISWWKIYY